MSELEQARVLRAAEALYKDQQFWMLLSVGASEVDPDPYPLPTVSEFCEAMEAWLA